MISRNGGSWSSALIVVVIRSCLLILISLLESIRLEWEKATCVRPRGSRMKENSLIVGKGA